MNQGITKFLPEVSCKKMENDLENGIFHCITRRYRLTTKRLIKAEQGYIE